jgi:hypothetical protein
LPYKDLQRKKEWEHQHRAQRLARRRELRQIEAAWKEAHPGAVRFSPQGTVASFLVPLAAGGALASYDPKLAIQIRGRLMGRGEGKVEIIVIEANERRR